jgi:hypothetical protein
MGTIGASDQFNKPEIPVAKKNYRNIMIPYELLTNEFTVVAQAIEHTVAEVKRFTSAHNLFPLPFDFENDEGESLPSRIVHAALLKLDESKSTISNATWEAYSEKYWALVTSKGGSHAGQGGHEGHRKLYYQDETSELINSIAYFIDANGKPAKKAFFNGEPSPKFMTIVALFHAVDWLEAQAKKGNPNDVTSDERT